LLVVAGADVRMTVKLAPSVAIDDGTANASLLSFTIVIGRASAWARSSCCGFTVDVEALNETDPKLSRGRTPRLPVGASWIHSADECEEV
jgi:hypothetical protein